MRTAAEEDRRKSAERIEALAGVVTSWQISEVYTDGNKGCAELVASVFPPEPDSTAGTGWFTGETFRDGTLDIRDALEKARAAGPRDNCAVYLRACIDVPATTDARLELGSDDGIKVWINAREVFSNPAAGPLRHGEEMADVRLEKGLNTLLVKITQGGGDWQAYARIRARDGTVIPNLRIVPARLIEASRSQ